MLSKFKQWLFPSPEELKLRKQELQRRIAERGGKSQPEAVTRVSFPSTRPSPLRPITLSSSGLSLLRRHSRAAANAPAQMPGLRTSYSRPY